MNTRPLVALLALACTAPPERRGADGSRLPELPTVDVGALARTLSGGLHWIDEPLVRGLPSSWQARGGKLRVYAGERGLSVVDRRHAEPRWVVGLEVVGFGRGSRSSPPGPASIWAEGGVFEATHDGIVEVLEQADDTLEHRFRLVRDPGGSEPLVIELAVTGARPYAVYDGASFVVDGRARVDWRGLHVRDHRGEELRAWTEVEGQTVRVVIDDLGAEWPIEVDPLLTEVDYDGTPDGGVGTSFLGWSVATDGRSVLVGDPGDVSDTDGAGVLVETSHWSVVRPFRPSPGEVGVGRSVAIDEDYVLVGSDEAEKVWLFHDSPLFGGWISDSTLELANAREFGASLSLEQGHLVVGSPGDAIQGQDDGAVYQYDLVALGTYPNRIPSPWLGFRARFGAAVAVSGERALIGAPGVGGLAVYRRRGDVLLLESELVWQMEAGGDLGSAVAFEGDVLAAGAPAANTAVVCEQVPGSEAFDDCLEISPPMMGVEGFGSGVALSADTLAVLDRPTSQSMARVHLFERRGGGWGWVESLDAGITSGHPLSIALEGSLLTVGVPDEARLIGFRRHGRRWLQDDLAGEAVGDGFGSSVAVWGNTAVIGAETSDVGVPDGGQIFVAHRDGPGEWTVVADRPGMRDGGRYGHAVAIEGDQVAVGAPRATYMFYTDAGLLEVSSFDGQGFSNVLTLPVSSGVDAPLVGGRLGSAVAMDANFVVGGAPMPSGDGRALLFQRNSQAVLSTRYGSLGPLTVAPGEVGDSCAIGSGFWLCGAPTTNSNRGSVFYRNLPDVSSAVAPELVGGTGDRFGTSVATDRGVLAVGAPGHGKVYLYTASGATFVPLITLSGGSDFGTTVSLDGDDLFVGSPTAGKVMHHRRDQNGPDTWGLVETYTGTAGHFGTSLSVQGTTLAVGESGTGSVPGTVHLIELGAAFDPVGAADTFEVDEDQALVVDAPGVLENDHDPNGGALTVSLVTPPTHALHFQLDPDGGFSYTPAPDWDQPDGFTYDLHNQGGTPVEVAVTLDVQPVNDPPVARDDAYSGNEDQVLVAAVGVLSNDADIETPRSGLRAQVVQDVPSGQLTLHPDGTFDYVPAPNLFGEVSFTYAAVDGDGQASPPATVTLTFAPTNDPPAVRSGPFVFQVTEDVGARFSHDEGLLSGDLVYDPDGDPLVAQLETPPVHGVAQVEPDGSWTYAPEPDFSGHDSFEFSADDGTSPSPPVTVEVIVVAADDPPVATDDGPFDTLEDTTLHIDGSALVRNDTDPDSVVLTASLDPQAGPTRGTVVFDSLTNDFVYTPNRDASGNDTFGYRVSDGNGVDRGQVVVRIREINDAPVAADDDAGEIRAEVEGNVLDNDEDVEGDVLTAEVVAEPLGGVLVLQPSGAFTYTANEGFVGADAFHYVANDARGGRSAPAVVSLVVLPDGGTTTGPGDTGCAEIEWYADADADGFGDPNDSVHGCDAPPSHVADGTDCDDTRAGSHPGAEEINDDGLDQDCDGLDNGLRAAGACDTAPMAAGSVAGLLAALTSALTARRRRS